MTWLAGIILAILLVYVLFGRRQVVGPALAVGMILLPLAARVVIYGVDLDLFRVLLIVVGFRILLSGQFKEIQWGRADRFILLWVLTSVVAKTILFGTMSALINRVGFAIDILGTLLAFRFALDDSERVDAVIRTFAWCSIPICLAMIAEQLTGWNAFSWLGANWRIAVREGGIRSQGPFSHPILAGTFGAACFPFAVYLYARGWKTLGVVTGLSMIAIALLPRSSGPVISLMAAVGLLLAWFWRRRMRALVWGAIAMMIFLQLVMKAPIWALMARAAVFGASTAWHRYFLFDSFIRHWPNWVLVGSRSTSGWGGAYDHLFDITNMYVFVGVEGGGLALFAFLAVFWRLLRGLGQASEHWQLPGSYSLWIFGAILGVHLVSFFGIAYFDQMLRILVAQWALAGTLVIIGIEKSECATNSP
ncbi:MAG: hypothetical protein P8020_19570 [Acidobacteriota bacterium]